MYLNDQAKNDILREVTLLAKNNYGTYSTKEEALGNVYQALEDVLEEIKNEFATKDLEAIAEEMVEDF